MSRDSFFMSHCLTLAKKGMGFVSPNPMVGAVVVKNDKILAEGYHKKCGGPHAEIVALQKLGFKALGATLYCNLEPCFHQGLTPPCVDPIIQSGIQRVVVAQQDPNPLVKGRSIKKLKKAGIQVDVGLLKHEAIWLNRYFNTLMSQKRPYVLVKVAMSLDAKIAPPLSNRKLKKPFWITGPDSRKEVHRLRSQVDAILVGMNTLLIDNPQLNVRLKGASQKPYRIVLDTHLKIPVNSQILNSKGGPVLIACHGGSLSKRKTLTKQGVILIDCPLKKGLIDLKFLMADLANKGIASVLVEGGGQVFSSFYHSGLVDEWIIFIAPLILGAKATPAFPSVSYLPPQLFSKMDISFKSHGRDLEFRFSKPKNK